MSGRRKVIPLLVIIGSFLRSMGGAARCPAVAMGLALCAASCQGEFFASGVKHATGRCSVSPDGSTIVFNELSGPYLAPGVAFDIYSIKKDGAGLTQLTSGPSVNYEPWFSPDGQSIAYISASSGEPGCHVDAMDSDGHNARQLTFGDSTDNSPSYSHDGSLIVFVRTTEHRRYAFPLIRFGEMIFHDSDVWVMGSDGSSPRQLTFERYFGVDAPYFSPDGKHVLFGADVRTGMGETFKTWHALLILDILKDGSAANLRPIPLPPSPSKWEYDGQPSFSPNGSTIVFTSLRVSRSSPFDYEIWMVGVDGTNLRQITHNQSRNRDPIFSPDGKYIYYGLPDGLWRMGADGSDPGRVVQ